MSRPFDVVTSPLAEGTTLLEASAGTGKTYALATLVLRLLLERKVDHVREILVVTFTNAATEELVTRIRARLAEALVVFERIEAGDLDGDDDNRDRAKSDKPDETLLRLCRAHDPECARRILGDALVGFDEASVYTIHGFCGRVLEQNALESGVGFEAELVEDARAIELEAARDFWRRHLYDASPLVAAVVVEAGLRPDDLAAEYREFARHPHTTLEPAPLPLAEAEAALAEAWRRAGARLAAAEVLATIEEVAEADTFMAGSDLRAVGADNLLALLARAGRGDAGALFCATRLTTNKLAKEIKKAGRDRLTELGVPAACEELERAIDVWRHALRAAFFEECPRRMRRDKQRLGIRTHDDVLGELWQALEDPARRNALVGAVSRQFRAALVDEFQDTDPVQYGIFTRLFPSSPLVFVGDPKQAIYAFRGADVFAYMQARRRVSDDGHYSLDTNYRSTQAMVDATNALFSGRSDAFVFEEIPFEEVRCAGKADARPLAGDEHRALTWFALPGEMKKEAAQEAACRMTADAVVELLEGPARIGDRAVEPGDIAVLVRTNQQGRDVQRSLVAAGVPAVLARSGDIFASEEMEEIARILAAVLDPARAPLVRAALATRVWGMDAADIERTSNDDLAWQDILERLTALRERWQRHGFLAMLAELEGALDARRRLLATAEGPRRLTNWLHAAELAHRAATERSLSPQALAAWIATERAAEHNGDAAELRLETDEDAVQIVTVHKSKGLEYGIVFAPFLWDSREPDPKKPLRVHVDADRVVYACNEATADHLDLARAENLAENLRLAYVALTRARHRCYVVWGNVRTPQRNYSAGCALAWLLRGAGSAANVDDSDNVDDNHGVEAESPSNTSSTGPFDALARRASAEIATDRDWTAQARTLAAAHPEFMTMIEADLEAPPRRRQAASPAAEQLAAGELGGNVAARLASALTTTSFSGLARRGPREQPDYVDPSSTPDSSEATGADRDPSASAADRAIFDFARGARAGNCLHEVFEHADFAAPAGDANRALVEATLARYGLDSASAHRADCVDPARTVATMVEEVLEASVPGTALRLKDVGAHKRRAEWEFLASVRSVSGARLASVLRRHGPPELADEYVASLAALAPGDVRGYLGGFVDLIFEHDGRWWVLDWKSNYLGNRLTAYDRPAMHRAMCEHHYILQYHLYVVALHRYLAARMPGYSYEEHFGGVLYAFLRGIRRYGEGGWYVERPSRELVEALDEAMQR